VLEISWRRLVSVICEFEWRVIVKESGSFLVLKALKTMYNVSKMAGRIKQKAYYSLHS